MARRYTNPIGFKQALENRLKLRAQEIGKDFGRVRQIAIFERFLARVVAHLGDRVVLKGGIALQIRVERARTTRDIDLRISGDPQSLLKGLRRAGQMDLDGDFLTFIVDLDPTHPDIEGEGVPYGGLRFRVEAKLAGKVYGSRFGLDVGFGDVMTRPPEVLSAHNLFEFAGIPPVSVAAYAREVHVAEKLHAFTLPRKRPNSRVKDLPDLALLATSGPFEHAALREAIHGTFAQRGSHDVPASVPSPPDFWNASYVVMVEENDLRWATLADLTVAVQAFLDPVLRGEEGQWDPASWSWR